MQQKMLLNVYYLLFIQMVDGQLWLASKLCIIPKCMENRLKMPTNLAVNDRMSVAVKNTIIHFFVIGQYLISHVQQEHLIFPRSSSCFNYFRFAVAKFLNISCIWLCFFGRFLVSLLITSLFGCFCCFGIENHWWSFYNTNTYLAH